MNQLASTNRQLQVMRFTFMGAILAISLHVSRLSAAPTASEATASSSTAEFAPEGAIDGDRFSTEPATAWKGRKADKSWWWQVRFPQPRDIGAILQINGDHPTVLRNAPKRYVWR